MALAPGTVLNKRYRIHSVLGQGGMGAVYHAVDENLGVNVAVKENLFLTDEYARQFQREASILASLRHPNLPRVGDYFIIPGQGQYLIMDYIEGEDLRERIERSGPLAEREVALMGAAICDALTYLHRRRPQIIHRDIKPGNIKITPSGEVILVDFGLAKVVQGNGKTTSGARAMTPGYSPPEQYGTAPTDPRSDIYSLGATLYAAITGEIPEDALARATGKARLTGLRDLSPHSSRKIAQVIETALEVEPEDRYQSAEEFKKALLQAVSLTRGPDEKILVTPPPPPVPGQVQNYVHPAMAAMESEPEVVAPVSSRRRRKSRRSTAGLIISALILIIAGGLAWIRPDLLPRPVSALFQTPTATVTPLTPVPTNTATIQPLPTQTQPAAETLPAGTAAAAAAQQTPTKQPSPTVTPFGGGHAQIAFSSDRSGSMQIWMMNVDGSQQRQLTDLPDGACLPAWSPDGETLAFISPCAMKRELYEGAKIYLWAADSKEDPYPLPLPASPAGDFYPAWSPDGTMLAFSTLRGTRSSIMLYHLDNGDLETLTEGRYADLQPVFSPDGRQIAFVRKFSTTELWVMGLRGDFAHRFSPASEINHHYPAWTPDGDFLLTSQSKNGGYVPWLVAYRVSEEGADDMRIPALGQPDPGPVSDVNISPDGAWIVYESWPDTNHDIYRMSINGANRERLTNNKSYDFAPAWRP